MKDGYEFFIDGVRLPIAPPSMTITIGSTNKTVTLINEGEINILKSPSLIEVSFSARFPMRSYPYAPNVDAFEDYWEKFQELKEKKKAFQFIVARSTPDGTVTWDTNLKVAIETMELGEDAEQGDDVIINFKLKQWKSYGTKTVKITQGKTSVQPKSNTSDKKNPTTGSGASTYTIQKGDTLQTIAKRFYNECGYHYKIYDANKTSIENMAKIAGKASSVFGNILYAGTKLTIPMIEKTTTK